MKTGVYQARKLRGWTSAQLNHKIRQAATRLGLTVSTPASLRVQISGWENGHHEPDATHQLLLQEAFGLPPEALGFEDPTEELAGTALAGRTGRPAYQVSLSDALLAYFTEQLSIHVRADNSAGPVVVLPTVTLQLRQLEGFTQHGPPEVVLLAVRFAEFAGWLFQDSGDDSTALHYTDRSVELAEASGELPLSIYALMRKSGALTSLREWQRAMSVAQKAVKLAEHESPSLLPVCLRQYALTQAYLRDERAAKAALHRALELSQTVSGPGKELSPYCTTSYLQMEAALSLLALGDPAGAAKACDTATEHWPTRAGLIRDQSLCFARLAVARSQLREVEGACEAARRATELVKAAPSARTIHMLRVIAHRLQPFKDTHAVQELTQALAEVA